MMRSDGSRMLALETPIAISGNTERRLTLTELRYRFFQEDVFAAAEEEFGDGEMVDGGGGDHDAVDVVHHFFVVIELFDLVFIGEAGVMEVVFVDIAGAGELQLWDGVDHAEVVDAHGAGSDNSDSHISLNPYPGARVLPAMPALKFFNRPRLVLEMKSTIMRGY